MNKGQHEIITTCKECKMRRMQNENIATCKISTWNMAIHKRVQYERKCNMKIFLHKEEQHGNGAIWKNCSMERAQHEKYKLSQ